MSTPDLVNVSTPAPGRRRPEDGYTVLEVMVVTMFMAIFGMAVQTSMHAFVRTTRVADDKTTVVGSVRVAEEAIARDMRAANPIDDIYPEPVSNYANKVSFSVYCSSPGVGTCEADGLRRVTYRVAENRLEQVVGSNTRILVGPNGQSAVPVEQRLGAVVNSLSEPVFTYLDKTGTPFPIASGDDGVTTRRIHDCTKSVRIHVKVISEPRNTSTPYNLVTTVELRNFNEVSGC
ncbi:MAG: hypothetical protein M3N31_03290 [Actinomycetota bacterium]|nr:hypothetical protein [Actinomycetota bacterium]